MLNVNILITNLVDSIERSNAVDGVEIGKGRVMCFFTDMDCTYVLVKGKKYWLYYYSTEKVNICLPIKPEKQPSFLTTWYDLFDMVDYNKTNRLLIEDLHQF